MRSWQASFVALATIWGFSFWFIKVGLRGLSPVEVAFWRLALGGAALACLALVSRTGLRLGARTWLHLLVVAALINAVPFTLFAYGETRVSSILAGIINAATPLATLAVTLAAFREEPVAPRQVAGLLVGFGGVLIVLGAWSGVPEGEGLGALACVAAICCYGVAYPYARRHLTGAGHPPLALATGQVVLATALLVPALPWAWGGGGAVDGEVVAAMLALGVLGSGVAFVLNFRIVEAAGATTASTVTYVIPLVAVAAGVVFLGESFAWHEPVGGLVVLLGVAVGSGRVPLPRRRGRPAG
jgi:drug/metabolite transporter (DMT)-like permease